MSPEREPPIRMPDAKQDFLYSPALEGLFQAPRFLPASWVSSNRGKKVTPSPGFDLGLVLFRSPSGFTRFPGKNSRDRYEVMATPLHKFFHTLKKNSKGKRGQ
jgi:hypothetical protein